MTPPFQQGDRVSVRDSYPALVLECKADAYGFDVLVTPESSGATRWVGSDQLTLLRKA